jgi:hypothetical protein
VIGITDLFCRSNILNLIGSLESVKAKVWVTRRRKANGPFNRVAEPPEKIAGGFFVFVSRTTEKTIISKLTCRKAFKLLRIDKISPQ